MVASGIGITVLPWMAQPQTVLDGERRDDGMLTYIPFEPPAPTRRVVLAWRRSFTRTAAIDAVRQAVMKAALPGVTRLDGPAQSAGSAASQLSSVHPFDRNTVASA
jgi:LysR family hydrogen peroxide-inducible transcriptional activator